MKLKSIKKTIKEWLMNRYGITSVEFKVSVKSVVFGVVYLAFSYGLIAIFS